jgi:hypothetical protein
LVNRNYKFEKRQKDLAKKKKKEEKLKRKQTRKLGDDGLEVDADAEEGEDSDDGDSADDTGDAAPGQEPIE